MKWPGTIVYNPWEAFHSSVVRFHISGIITMVTIFQANTSVTNMD